MFVMFVMFLTRLGYISLGCLGAQCYLTVPFFFVFFFHYKSMGPFNCHSNQAKRQITIILDIFKSPYPSNIPTLSGKIISAALEELSF